MRSRAAVLAVALLAVSCEGGPSCGAEQPYIAEERRVLLFAGKKAADVVELTRRPKLGGLYVERQVHLVGRPRDRIVTTVNLDEHGFVEEARYVRTGPSGRRLVDLRARDGRMEIFAAVGQASIVLPERPVVLVDQLRRVKPAASPREVVFVDLSSAEHALGRIDPDGAAYDASGALLAKGGALGAFLEHAEGEDVPPAAAAPVEPVAFQDGAPPERWALRLDGLGPLRGSLQLGGPGQRVLEEAAQGGGAPTLLLDRAVVDDRVPDARHYHHQPFIESRSPPVVAFAKKTAADRPAVEAARLLVEAVHPLVDAGKGGGPPSAMGMLDAGGDCDGAAALVVASLRALGIPARPVVGWRVHEGRLVPHAWAELHTPAGWMMADATLPGVGVFSTHVGLFEGLGGALSMGRVLGVARPTVVAPPER